MSPNDLLHGKMTQDPEGDLYDPINRRAKVEQAFKNWVKIFQATVTPRQNYHRHNPKTTLKRGDVVLMTDSVDSSGKMKMAKIISTINPRRYCIEYIKNGRRVRVLRHSATLALIEPSPVDRQG